MFLAKNSKSRQTKVRFETVIYKQPKQSKQNKTIQAFEKQK